jgi:Phage tail tube protein
MALAPLKGTQILIKVGNGAGPEVFTHPCLINMRRGIQFRSSANKVIVPDCANPDDPAWEHVFKDNLGCTITGAGVLNTGDVADYDTWFRGDAAKNIQAWLGSVGKWVGAFKLTQWEINGERNNNTLTSLTLESHGAVAAFV